MSSNRGRQNAEGTPTATPDPSQTPAPVTETSPAPTSKPVTPSVTPQAPPAATTNAGEQSTAEKVLEGVTFGGVALAELGALAALLGTEAGRKTSSTIAATILEGGKAAFDHLGSEKGPVGKTADEFADWAEAKADEIERETAEEDALRTKRTGIGIFRELFRVDLLISNTRAGCKPKPKPKYVMWPF